MTEDDKKAAKLKSKERYTRNQAQYEEKRQLSASIRTFLKCKTKTKYIQERLAKALGNRPESHVDADKVVGVCLQQREQDVYELSNILANFVYTMKSVKLRCDKEEEPTSKFIAMMGRSLHTKFSEAFFVDATYKPMEPSKLHIDELGAAITLMNGTTEESEQELIVTDGSEKSKTWKCKQECNIDQKMVYDRFYTIIQATIDASPQELVDFITNLDICDLQNSANVGKRGHLHACYIINEIAKNYGCSSILLFLRTLSPHFPFVRNLVYKLYSARKHLKSIKYIDKLFENLKVEDSEELKRISEELKQISEEFKRKLGDDFVSTTDWPYAHEDNIVDRHFAAFTILKKKSLDIPNIVCFSCMELCSKSNVHYINDKCPSKHRAIERLYDDLLDYHENNGVNYDYACTYCFEKMKKTSSHQHVFSMDCK